MATTVDAAARPDAPLARLMALASERSAQFVTQLHPAWADMAWPGAAAWLAALDSAAARRRAALALRTAWGIEWPSLGALAQRLNRAALLPRQALLAWLCAAALFLRRREVRRCVGRAQRQALADMVGADALQAIMAAPDSGPGPVNPPPLAGQPATALAAWAFDVLSVQRAWSCEHARRLIAVGLAPSVGGPPTAPPRPQPNLSLTGFTDQLADYFPTYSWLFGSDMDRALSA